MSNLGSAPRKIAPSLACLAATLGLTACVSTKVDDDPTPMNATSAAESTAAASTSAPVVPTGPVGDGGPTMLNPNCIPITAAPITNFDNYDPATPADAFTFYLNGMPGPDNPSAVLVGVLHISDGTGTISTQMMDDGAGGYELSIANTLATGWGGNLTTYLLQENAQVCLNASTFSGLRLGLRGTSGTGRVGISLQTKATLPSLDADGNPTLGTCDPDASAMENENRCYGSSGRFCCDPTYEVTLPPSVDTWVEVTIPWGQFANGYGTQPDAVVPTSGSDIVRVTIAPYMVYLPPDYSETEDAPYTVVVDDVTFY